MKQGTRKCRADEKSRYCENIRISYFFFDNIVHGVQNCYTVQELNAGGTIVKHFSAKTLVLYALFIALTFVLGMTIGLIPLGFINVTILAIPVIVGTMVLGLKAGLLFGAFFGLASALSAFGLSLVPPSALASALVAANPLLAILMCFVPRLLIPLTTHIVYRTITRNGKFEKAGIAPAAVAGSLTNTVFYLGLMLLFYSIMGLDSAIILGIIGGTGLIAGFSEAAVAAVIATPVVVALHKLNNK